jgi:hypothetical protein
LSDVTHSQFAADLSRLHLLLSLADGNPEDLSDLRFEAAIRRRLNKDPAQARQLRQIASEVAILVSD